MKSSKLLFHLIFLAVIWSSCSRYNVVHVEHNTATSKKNGLYYSLPKTIVTIDVTVTKTEKIRGPYFAFADKYLGLKNVISANSTDYEISDIAFNTFSEPDSAQLYFLEIKKYGKRNKSIYLALSESGIIQSANVKPEKNREINNSSSTILNPITDDDNYNFFAESNIFEKVDTIIEKVNLDTTIIERKTFKHSFVEKSIELKAKEAADFIMRTKESRFNVISGSAEVAYEKGSIQYMNEELLKIETDYMNLFTGITKTKTLKYRYTYVPEKMKSGMTRQLFLFSTKEGVVDSTSNTWEPVEILMNSVDNLKNISVYTATKEKLNPKKHGLYYRLPDYTMFTIKQGNDIIKSETILISQLGVVTFLPAKKNYLQFYPNIGSLKSVKVCK